MRARQVHLDDYTQFEYIICMDSNNERDTRAVFGSKSDGNAKVFKFMDLLPDKKTDDVPDPYYTGNFDEVYELISKAVNGCCRGSLRTSSSNYKL